MTVEQFSSGMDDRRFPFQLGFEQMFTDFADFSALANVPLLVNQVYQKIYIHVDEEGSEAAAATGMHVLF